MLSLLAWVHAHETILSEQWPYLLYSELHGRRAGRGEADAKGQRFCCRNLRLPSGNMVATTPTAGASLATPDQYYGR